MEWLRRSLLFFIFIASTWAHLIPEKLVEVKVEDSADQKPTNFSAAALMEEDLVAMDRISRVNKGKDLNLLFEGDINLLDLGFEKKSQSPAMKKLLGNRFRTDQWKRDTKRDRRFLWRSRTVPYTVAEELDMHRNLIEEAMKHISAETCIKFKPKENETNWIHFVQREGCWSSVGRMFWREGPQEISLGNGCYRMGTVVHEILHSLGFWHEQSRPDRDQYIEIFWENIADGEESNFEKSSHRDVNTWNVQYDLTSVMHYGKYSFSKNNKPTIIARGNPEKKLGQTNGLSALDVVQLNALYDCSNVGKSHWSSWSEFSSCSEVCYKERQRFCSSSDLDHCLGSNRYGIQSEFVQCKEDATECYAPVDGHWGRWSRWSACTVTCGQGKHSRTRHCDDPYPRYNGKACKGESQETQPCSMGSCTLGPDDCSFDVSLNPMCHWNKMQTTPNFNWVLQQGKTPSVGTGPSGDHTTGKGTYLYVESSPPANPGDRTYLFSRSITEKVAKCLSFYYHMFGQTMGFLRVFLQLYTTEEVVLVWSKFDNQGNEWHKATVTIDKDPPYRIIFEAIRGSDYQSDIALDDIYLRSGKCDKPGFTAAPDLTTSRPTVKLPPERLGCYKDDGSKSGRRPFPRYTDLRSSIDWRQIDGVVQECSRIAKGQGAQFFAIQFYGECWYGNSSEVDYARDGTTDNCWKSVGKANTMMVYRLKN